MQDETNIEELSWPVFGVIFGVMFGISASSLFYWIHATYFLFRRYKYGLITKATIIDKEIVEYSGRRRQKTNKYRIKYIYSDHRVDFTEKCIQILTASFISTNYNEYIPIEIHQLICQYLFNSLIFWYGPYEIEAIVPETLFRETYIGSKIPIKYDPLYAKNVHLNLQFDTNYINQSMSISIWYWFRWFGGLLISLGGCIFFLFMIAPKLTTEHYQELIIIIISCTVLILSIAIICTFYIKGSGCFRSWTKGELQCIDSNEHTKIEQIDNKKELLSEQYKETNILYFETSKHISLSFDYS